MFFTRVCDSVHGGSASVHAGIPSPCQEDTPQQGEPPAKETPRQGDTTPRQGDPLPRRPPTKETPLPRRPPTLPRRPPVKETPPAKETPPPAKENPSPPGSRLRHTVNERPVRILLECILVFGGFFVGLYLSNKYKHSLRVFLN